MVSVADNVMPAGAARPAARFRPWPHLLRAWLVIAIVDGLFASALNIFAYHSTFAQLWQRVASTVIGPTAMQGGTRSVLIGLALHAAVALLWTTVFLALYMMWPMLRRVTRTWSGVIGTAVTYGAIVWLLMSFVVIPARSGRMPTIGTNWWVQLFGHIPFVALPIVAMIARPRANP